MALNISTLRDQRSTAAVFVSTQRVALTAAGEPVEETDPRAVEMLVGVGGAIPASLAQRYGLIPPPEPVAAAPKPRAEARIVKPEVKRRQDLTDKARHPGGSKAPRKPRVKKE